MHMCTQIIHCAYDTYIYMQIYTCIIIQCIYIRVGQISVASVRQRYKGALLSPELQKIKFGSFVSCLGVPTLKGRHTLPDNVNSNVRQR